MPEIQAMEYGYCILGVSSNSPFNDTLSSDSREKDWGVIHVEILSSGTGVMCN